MRCPRLHKRKTANTSCLRGAKHVPAADAHVEFNPLNSPATRALIYPHLQLREMRLGGKFGSLESNQQERKSKLRLVECQKSLVFPL